MEEKADKTSEPKLESLSGKYIIRSKDYGGSYYDGNAGYHSEFAKAKIYNEGEVPDYIKNNPREEVIALDSEEGLKLLVDEIHNLEHYVSIEKPRIKDAEEGLKKLYNFDLVQRYVEFFNGINPIIRRDNEETKHNLVERVIEEKEKSKSQINPEAENNAKARKDFVDDLFGNKYKSN